MRLHFSAKQHCIIPALYISNLDRLDVSMRYIDANYMKMPIKIVSVKFRSFHLKRFTIFKANNSHTIYVEVGKIELMKKE